MADKKKDPAPAAAATDFNPPSREVAAEGLDKRAIEGFDADDQPIGPAPSTLDQREATPEELPASAKVTPPAEQVNRNAGTAVGTGGPAVLDEADKAIADGIEAHADHTSSVIEKANAAKAAKLDVEEDIKAKAEDDEL